MISQNAYFIPLQFYLILLYFLLRHRLYIFFQYSHTSDIQNNTLHDILKYFSLRIILESMKHIEYHIIISFSPSWNSALLFFTSWFFWFPGPGNFFSSNSNEISVYIFSSLTNIIFQIMYFSANNFRNWNWKQWFLKNYFAPNYNET